MLQPNENYLNGNNSTMQISPTHEMGKMTSLQISEITGKPHNDVLKAIRNMELAWIKVNGGNFSLVEYLDAKGEKRPMYELSKTECLYIATKFNDEARAKLIIRWEQLESNKQNTIPQSFSEALMLAARQAEQIELQEKQLKSIAPKAQYFDHVLQSTSTYTMTQVAKELGMSAQALEKKLHEKGIIFKQSSQWLLYAKYQDKGYTKSRTHHYIKSDETTGTNTITVWTESGRRFIHSLFTNF